MRGLKNSSKFRGNFKFREIENGVEIPATVAQEHFFERKQLMKERDRRSKIRGRVLRNRDAGKPSERVVCAPKGARD